MRLAVDVVLREDLKLSLPQFGTLTWLAQEPGLSTADLARLNRVSPQNMGMAVTRLLSRGYIERTPPRRGRVAELRLTESGLTALKDAAARVQLVQEKMMSGLTKTERDELPGMLNRMRRALVSSDDHRIAALAPELDLILTAAADD